MKFLSQSLQLFKMIHLPIISNSKYFYPIVAPQFEEFYESPKLKNSLGAHFQEEKKCASGRVKGRVK